MRIFKKIEIDYFLVICLSEMIVVKIETHPLSKRVPKMRKAIQFYHMQGSIPIIDGKPILIVRGIQKGGESNTILSPATVYSLWNFEPFRKNDLYKNNF